jgi:hypothetical protein
MTKEQTLQVILTGVDSVADKGPQGRFGVRSDWLVTLINDIRTSTYPYNRTVEEAAEKSFGVTLTIEQKGELATLVYNAQRFADEDRLADRGFVRATQPVLARLVGQKVTAIQNGELTGEQSCLVVQAKDGRYVLKAAGKRSVCLADYADNWVQIRPPKDRAAVVAAAVSDTPLFAQTQTPAKSTT